MLSDCGSYWVVLSPWVIVGCQFLELFLCGSIILLHVGESFTVVSSSSVFSWCVFYTIVSILLFICYSEVFYYVSVPVYTISPFLFVSLNYSISIFLCASTFVFIYIHICCDFSISVFRVSYSILLFQLNVVLTRYCFYLPIYVYL